MAPQPRPRVPAQVQQGVLPAAPIQHQQQTRLGTSQQQQHQRRPAGSSSSGNGGQRPAVYSNGMGMGGMGGMGMPMGGYGMGMGMPMGMGMGMGMGGMGMMGGPLGLLSGPLSLIYSLNFFMASLGQVMDVLGMNSHAILHAYRQAHQRFVDAVEAVKTSEARRWLQRKCRKSPLFRLLLVLAAGALVGSAVKAIETYVAWRRRRMLTQGPVHDREGRGAMGLPSFLQGLWQ